MMGAAFPGTVLMDRRDFIKGVAAATAAAAQPAAAQAHAPVVADHEAHVGFQVLIPWHGDADLNPVVIERRVSAILPRTAGRVGGEDGEGDDFVDDQAIGAVGKLGGGRSGAPAVNEGERAVKSQLVEQTQGRLEIALALPGKSAAGQRMLNGFNPLMQRAAVQTTASYYKVTDLPAGAPQPQPLQASGPSLGSAPTKDVKPFQKPG